MYEISEEMMAEQYRSSIFAKPLNDFCRQWMDDHCDPDDLALMKAVRASLWGPGLGMTETDYLTMTMGRTPSREEVVALIDRVSRLMEPCYEAWCNSTERKELWLIYKERLLQEHDETHAGYARAWAKLRERVLRHGGSEVVPPPSPDPLIELLGEHGVVVPESTTAGAAPARPRVKSERSAARYRSLIVPPSCGDWLAV